MTSHKPSDLRWMNVALAQAEMALGQTAENPAVGCAILSADNRLVGVGRTSPSGRPHAEVNALMKAKKILNRSELKQSKLMVVRIGTNSMDNPLKYSKPCKVCQNFIEKLGVQLVYYSTSNA